MREIWQFIVAGTVGIGAGAMYFGGLWLTVRRLQYARWPALLLLGSMVGRTTIGLLALYLVMDMHWERALVYLAGFLLARTVLIQRLRPTHVEVGGRVL